MEILVVMAIMAILVALGIGLLGTAGQQARIVRTQTLLKRLDDLVQKKLREIDNDKSFSSKLATFQQNVTLTNSANAAASDKVYSIVARKCLYRRAIPVQSLDLKGWDTMNNWDDSPVTATSRLNATTITSAEEHASALFYALCPDGSIPEGITSDLVATRSNGKLMFVDAWGNPIRFYLWPTRLFAYSGMTPPNLANAQVLITGLPANTDRMFKSDPADPNGLMKQHKYLAPPMTMPVSIDASNLHDVGTYSQFLVVSAGPDGELGLHEPYNNASFGHLGAINNASALTDDLSNRQGR